MTKDEALDLALEALELSAVTVDSFGVQKKTQEAITAIKQALAAPTVGEPRARLIKYIGKGPYPKPGYTVARTYEECPENQYPDAWEEGEKLYTTPPAQPEPVQEPVAVTYKEVADTMNALWGGTLKQVQIAMELANKKLYTTPPAQPEPVQPVMTDEKGRPISFWGGKSVEPIKQPAPASWMETVTANLVREGVNKHKARELAEHFYGLKENT